MHSPTSSPETTSAGSRRSIALLLLNAVLLMALAAVTFNPGAEAQVRPRGDYLMVGGGVAGSNADVVYIVDTVNEEMIALTYDSNAKVIEGIGYRNLVADGASLNRGRAN